MNGVVLGYGRKFTRLVLRPEKPKEAGLLRWYLANGGVSSTTP